MPFALTPVDASFGAVVTGQRLADLDDETFDAVHRAWLEHALLIFPGQHLTNAEQVAFARRFGPLELELINIGNVRPDGRLRGGPEDENVMRMLEGNNYWHADSTYLPLQAKGAVFTAHVIPEEGGDTEWADMRSGYDALPPGLQARVDGLSVYHSIARSQARLGYPANPADPYTERAFKQEPPLRPLVKIHPETGRRALAIGRHAFSVQGLSDAESEQFLDALTDFACQPPRIYRHRWTEGDAVLWDNRCLLHRGRPWNMAQPRVMYHTRLAGDPASELAMGTPDARMSA